MAANDKLSLSRLYPCPVKGVQTAFELTDETCEDLFESSGRLGNCESSTDVVNGDGEGKDGNEGRRLESRSLFAIHIFLASARGGI